MSSYRIVCVNTEYPHRHIVKVGTGTEASTYTQTWSVKEVRDALENGDTFYTVSPSTGKVANVRAYTCNEPGCTFKTIRSDEDAVTDNDLDYMNACG